MGFDSLYNVKDTEIYFSLVTEYLSKILINFIFNYMAMSELEFFTMTVE